MLLSMTHRNVTDLYRNLFQKKVLFVNSLNNSRFQDFISIADVKNSQ